MTDNNLIILLRQRIIDCLTANNWTYPVLSKMQPTQQGVEPVDSQQGSAVYFQKLYDEKWGFPMTSQTFDPVTGLLYESTEQNIATTFKISALAIQLTTDITKPTASDIVNYVNLMLQTFETIRIFTAQGVNILRVTIAQNEYFEDDRHRNEAHPTFDITLCHTNTVTTTVPYSEQLVPSDTLI